MEEGPSEQRMTELFNVIEELRTLGVDDVVKLPQIVSCGQQSAGKSSTFQALSQAPFPVGNSLCTRHPTRLILKHSERYNIHATIERDPNTDNGHFDFSESSTNLKDLPNIMSKASQQLQLGNDPGQAHFCGDVVQLEICGPDGLNLTLLDLPGMFSNPRGQVQTQTDKEYFNHLVKCYVDEPNTIVLAIIPAAEEIENSSCLEFLREKTQVKPANIIGVLTKPNKAGNELRAHIITDILNEEHADKVSVWHFIQNGETAQHGSTYKEFKTALDQRNIAETMYFDQPDWKALPKDMTGVDALKALLKRRQYELLCQSMPVLLRNSQKRLTELEREIEKSRSSASFDQARTMLRELGGVLRTQLSRALDGKILILKHDPKFNLRTKLGELNKEFVKSLKLNVKEELDLEDEFTDIYDGLNPERRDQLIDDATVEIEDSTGPKSMMSPNLVKRLYNEHTKKWPGILRTYIQAISDTMKDCVEAIVDNESKLAKLRQIKNEITLMPLVQLRLDLTQLARHCIQSPELLVTRQFDLDLRAYKAASAVRVKHMITVFKEVLEVGDNVRPDEVNAAIARALNNEPHKLDEVQKALKKDENEIKSTAHAAVACMICQYKTDYDDLISKDLNSAAVARRVKATAEAFLSETAIHGLDRSSLAKLAGSDATSPADDEHKMLEHISVLRTAIPKLQAAVNTSTKKHSVARTVDQSPTKPTNLSTESKSSPTGSRPIPIEQQLSPTKPQAKPVTPSSSPIIELPQSEKPTRTRSTTSRRAAAAKRSHPSDGSTGSMTTHPSRSPRGESPGKKAKINQ